MCPKAKRLPALFALQRTGVMRSPLQGCKPLASGSGSSAGVLMQGGPGGLLLEKLLSCASLPLES